MVERKVLLREMEKILAGNPVCALLGPRQCGKTTLAREFAARQRKGSHLFDMESAAGQARLANPELALDPLKGLIVIDEVQRKPELFAVIRPLADRPRKKAKFLLLGSASPELVRGVSESLAGRAGFVDLGGFDLREVGAENWRRLWLRGGFPRSYLARSDAESLRWRGDFTRTFLERDIAQLGFRTPAELLRRFWMMLAHYHGQIWNGAELAGSLGVSEHAVRGYLDILTGTFVIRQLPPWFQNVGKRQYKSPKVYVRDSGLLHSLLSIGTHADLQSHPKYGASWEGFAIEQVLSALGARDAYYWGTHSGAELDLMIFRCGKRYGFEFKCADAPGMTKSLHIALEDLKLERAWIVYPGREAYPVHKRVDVLPIVNLEKTLAKLR